MSGEWETAPDAGDGWEPALSAEELARKKKEAAALAKSAKEREERRGIFGGIPEAAVSLASGALAGPVSGIAGLAGAALPGQEFQGADWTRKVQEAMTVEPESKGGKAITRVATLLPELYGQGTNKAGEWITDVTGSPLAGTAVNTALQALPLAIAPAAGRTVGGLAQGEGWGARGLMRSSLKPGEPARRRGVADPALDTLLTEPRPGGGLPGYNVSPAGAEALTERIGTLNDLVNDAIRNSPATVDKNLAASRLTSEVNRVANQPSWRTDMGSIQNAWQEFLDNPRIANITDIPVQLAQDMKVASNRSVRGRYGEISAQDVQNQKAIRRGLREEIAAAVPEVAPLNAEMGPLINARDLVERRVGVEGNKNPGGLGWLTTSPAKFIGWLADRSGASKSTIARLLYQTGEVAPALSEGAARANLAMSPYTERERERRRRLAEMLKGR